MKMADITKPTNFETKRIYFSHPLQLVQRLDYWLGKTEIDSWQRQAICLFPIRHRPAMRPSQHPIQREPGAAPEFKAVVGRSWPVMYVYCRGQEWVEVCLQSPTCLDERQEANFYHFNTLYHASFIILYCGQQMHNYFTNYHTPTCFDTVVSSSRIL